jgi:hypothetical protein
MHDLATACARGEVDERVRSAEAALFDLRPVTPDRHGALGEEIEAFGREYARRGGFELTCAIDPDALGIQDGLLSAVAREPLANATRAVGGSLDVRPRPGGGTEVRACIPIDARLAA